MILSEWEKQIYSSVLHCQTGKQFKLTPEYAEQIAKAVVDECNRLVDADADDASLVACVKHALLAIAARYEALTNAS